MQLLGSNPNNFLRFNQNNKMKNFWKMDPQDRWELLPVLDVGFGGSSGLTRPVPVGSLVNPEERTHVEHCFI